MMFLFALLMFGLIFVSGVFMLGNAFAIGGVDANIAIILGVVLTLAIAYSVFIKK